MTIENKHLQTISQLKSAILSSRYRVAVLANKEMLGLYFGIGKLISEKAREEKWRAKALEVLSNDLQNELPGLRGFSASNIKKMRIFYETWADYFAIGSLSSNQLENNSGGENQMSIIGSMMTNQLPINTVLF